jgi:carbon monoxide dehydrogenase subunit G
MASIRKETLVVATPEQLWDAVRDVGAIHTRLAPGFVVDTRMEGDETRVVTFANGMVVREPIIDVDDANRRLAWGATGGQLTHYSASMQILDTGQGASRVVWIADLLPHEMAEPVGEMMQQGLSAIRNHFEGGYRARV